MSDDLAAVAAGFGAALRQAGLPVGTGRSERFAAAVTLVRPATAPELLDCALATLVSSKEQAELLRSVFAQVFGPFAAAPEPDAPSEGEAAAARRQQPESLATAADVARTHAIAVEAVRTDAGSGADDDSEGDEQEISRPYLGSPAERLAGTDFAELSESELASLPT